MAINGIRSTHYPVRYETRRTERNAVNVSTFTTHQISNDENREKAGRTENYQYFIQKYKEEILTKVQNGDTEPAFQIGALSLTEKEWDELLEKFDSAEKGNIQETQKTKSISKVQMDMLSAETVQARFTLQEVDEEGNPKEDLYLIAIDKNGIRCSKAGSDEYEWQIIFTDESQYQRTVEFMDWADERMDNFLFSAHKNFWEDYLNDNMDVDGFKNFLEGTNNGIPDYSFTIEDSMYIDREKAQWAKYMNRPSFFTVLSKEELLLSIDEELKRNKKLYGKKIEDFTEDSNPTTL